MAQSPAPSPSTPVADPSFASRATEQPVRTGEDGRTGDEPRVPERPRLEPDVRLAGQMLESAFKDPPWLLEREGTGYIQITELLYRIAELSDGQHSLAQIAEEVSRSTGRSVSPANVQQLIFTQFIARGLMAPEGAPAIQPDAAAGAGQSPLALNMKMKTIPPERLDRITAVLKVLFWPPILVAVLVAAAMAQVWMYAIHGIGGSVSEALAAPALMLLVLAVIVLAAAFHELGHAAALHYGGGRVKGMGAGFYLVYPAFYTDVSDNYRLPRWARVRTDLGGFYFNLIFALVVMAMYVVTGQEILLLIITLINFEIIYQLLPFVRLDGYWTLADITGVPDFFSQMGAFVRSAIPFKSKGRKLPELKWWGKAVFAVYMLVTIPALIFLLIALVQSIPRVLATAWESFQTYADTFRQSQGAGDFLGMAGAALQIALLGIPVFGSLFALYSIGRALITAVWTWSKPSPTRRLAAGLGSVAVLLVLGYLWAPQLPFGEGARGPLADRLRFEPIRRGERMTLGDVVSGAVVTREPRGALAPTPVVTASPVAAAPSATVLGGTPTATSGAAANATPTSGSTPTAALATATVVISSGATTPTQNAAQPAPGAPTTVARTLTSVPSPTSCPTPAPRTGAPGTPIIPVAGGCPTPTPVAR